MISSADLMTRASSIVLLGVDDGQALPLHLEEERGLDDVDADRQVRDAGVGRAVALISATADSMSPTVGATAPRKPRKPAR